MARVKPTRVRKPPPLRTPEATRKITKRDGDELLRRVRDGQVATGLIPVFPPTQNYDFSEVTRLGVVVDVGPNGEPDFTDHRYWLALAISDNNESDAFLPTRVVKAEEAYRRKVIVATNLAEATAKTHTVPLDTAVVIQRVYDTRARDRYYFHSGTSAASASEWCIVRSVPDDASIYVDVQRITLNDSDPWDGGFEFTGEVVPAFCWPGTRGGDFKALAYDGGDANNPVAQVLDLEERQGGKWVKPWAKVEYKSIQQSSQIRFSDCNPMKRF